MAARKAKAASRKATRESIAQDKKTMGAERASVFGIELGEGLTFPACSASSSSSTNCVQSDSADSSAQARHIADLEDASIPEDVEFKLVRLAAERCPSWVNGLCEVSVATKSGYVIGVAFLTAEGQAESAEQSINEKYGSAPTSRSNATCQGTSGAKRKAADRTWALPRITIGYRALDTCEQGRVLVETETMTSTVSRAKPAPLGEPKM
jgi:hypothetical protein